MAGGAFPTHTIEEGRISVVADYSEPMGSRLWCARLAMTKHYTHRNCRIFLRKSLSGSARDRGGGACDRIAADEGIGPAGESSGLSEVSTRRAHSLKQPQLQMRSFALHTTMKADDALEQTGLCGGTAPFALDAAKQIAIARRVLLLNFSAGCSASWPACLSLALSSTVASWLRQRHRGFDSNLSWSSAGLQPVRSVCCSLGLHTFDRPHLLAVDRV